MPLSMTALALAVIAGNVPLLFFAATSDGGRAVLPSGCRLAVAFDRPPHGAVFGGGGADAGLERPSRSAIAGANHGLEAG